MRASPIIGPDGVVYVGSHNHRVYAIEGSDGTLLWEYVAGGSVDYSSPVLTHDGSVLDPMMTIFTRSTPQRVIYYGPIRPPMM